MTKLTLLTAVLGLAVLSGCEAGPESATDSYATADLAEVAPAYDLADLGAEAEAGEMDAVSMEPMAQRAMQSPSPAPPTAEAPAVTPPPSALAGRSLRRSADLRVSTDDYHATLRDARAIAPRFGGLVAGEDGSANSEYAQTTLTLRVPSDRFDAALNALAALGEVESRSLSVDDVTGQVVDLEARLRSKRAAESRYIGFVGQAGSIAEMMDVQRQLDAVRAEIEVMESHIRSLQSAVSLSTIRATVVGTAVVLPPAPTPGVFAQIADGIAAGWHGILAVLLGILPLWPLAVIGAFGFAVWRRWQRPVAV